MIGINYANESLSLKTMVRYSLREPPPVSAALCFATQRAMSRIRTQSEKMNVKTISSLCLLSCAAPM